MERSEKFNRAEDEIMTQEELGKKLKLAREQAGLSQEEVADKLTIPRASVSMLENAQRKVDSLELLKLANLYGKSPAGFFEEPEQVDEKLTVLFRATAALDVSQDVLDEFREFSENYLWLSRLMNAPPISTFLAKQIKGESRENPKQLAERVRNMLGLGVSPIPDIFAVLGLFGVHVLRKPIPDEVSGVFLHQPTVGTFVLINSNPTKGRQAFTAAHELSHFLRDKAHPGGIECNVGAPHPEARESYANNFAAELLIPKEGIEEWMRTNEKSTDIDAFTVVHLAQWFRVSYFAMIVRLKQLEYITTSKVNSLKADSPTRIARQLGYEPDESSLEGPTVFPHEYRRLAFEAYHSGKISLERLAELLETPIWDIQSILKETAKKDKAAGTGDEVITLAQPK